jgi:hypothetical protein
MTGARRLAPILLLLAFATGGALWLARPPDIPREGPPLSRDRQPEALPPPAPPARISGRILGSASGAWLAVSGARETPRVYLDEAGAFDFAEVASRVPLSLWLGPDPDGASVCRLATDLILEPGEHRRLELRSECATAVRGLVKSREGAPLVDVRVAVLHPDRDWRQVSTPVAAVTGRDGRFFVGFREGTPPSALRLVFDRVAEGYILEERVVGAVSPGAGVELTVELEQGLEIAGVVLDHEGRPVTGATVHLREDYRGEPAVRRAVEGLVTTDEEGRFHDDALRDSVYRIVVAGELEGVEFAAVKDGVHAGDTNVSISFLGYGSARIAFADATSGEPVTLAGGAIEFVYGVRGEEEWYVPWEFLPDKTEVALPRLPEGHYRVQASHPSYEPLTSDLLYVTANEDLGLVRFDLTPRKP